MDQLAAFGLQQGGFRGHRDRFRIRANLQRDVDTHDLAPPPASGLAARTFEACHTYRQFIFADRQLPDGEVAGLSGDGRIDDAGFHLFRFHAGVDHDSPGGIGNGSCDGSKTALRERGYGNQE
jgi:hypothetical protein